MKILIVIPARLESQRIKRKHLIEFINGKTLFQMTYESCCKTQADKVIIATDDILIYNRAKIFTQDVEITSVNHHNGTSRCAEVSKRYQEYDIILNIQGDEPLIDPNSINILIESIKNDNGMKDMYTCITKFGSREEVESTNNIKVVYDTQFKAMYFSRNVIPYYRDGKFEINSYRKHVGMYAFTRDSLFRYTNMLPSKYEEIEKLEYLRILENGGHIQFVEIPKGSVSVNIEADICILNSLLKE